jgi:hypothetical protein
MEAHHGNADTRVLIIRRSYAKPAHGGLDLLTVPRYQVMEYLEAPGCGIGREFLDKAEDNRRYGEQHITEGTPHLIIK